ncbi:MAG: mechanosensitive ion channel family protein [Candidatus Bipolaricaulaceae bacterium]
MNLLRTVYYGNPVWLWMLAASIVVAVFLALRLARGLLLRRLRPLAERTKTDLDNFLVDLVRQTRLFFLAFLALYAGTLAVDMPAVGGEVIARLVLLAFFLQTGFWGNAGVGYWVARTARRKLELEEDAATATTVRALGVIGRIILWTILLLLALDNLGVEITSLIAGLGIGGIAIALAVQNVLGDLFASLSIVLDKPFVIGDFIIVDQFLGTVEKIGLKTTRVRSLGGEQLIFSNKDLLQSRIRNYKRMFERRIVFSFGVTYQTPYEKLQAIPGMVREIVEAQPMARFDRAHFKSYGDFSLNFEVVYYMLNPDYNLYMDTQQAINLALHKKFAEQEIDFAYPTQTVYVHTQPPRSPQAPEQG